MARRKSKKKKVIIAFIIGIIGAVFLFISMSIVIFLMAVYRPSDYNPQPVDYDHQEKAVDNAIALVADIHNNVYASDNFTEVVNADLLNTLLLHDDMTKLLEMQMLNSEFKVKYPQLSLKDGQLILYFTANYTRHSSVVSVVFEPNILPNGMLEIKLDSIRTGALGVPKMFIRSHLISLAESIKQMVENNSKPQHPEGKKEIEKELGKMFGKALPELLKNDKIEINPLITDPEDDGLNIKLTDIKSKDQKLSLTFSKIKQS